jgi:hypothetical protein
VTVGELRALAGVRRVRASAGAHQLPD